MRSIAWFACARAKQERPCPRAVLCARDCIPRQSTKTGPERAVSPRPRGSSRGTSGHDSDRDGLDHDALAQKLGPAVAVHGDFVAPAGHGAESPTHSPSHSAAVGRQQRIEPRRASALAGERLQMSVQKLKHGSAREDERKCIALTTCLNKIGRESAQESVERALTEVNERGLLSETGHSRQVRHVAEEHARRSLGRGAIDDALMTSGESLITDTLR